MTTPHIGLDAHLLALNNRRDTGISRYIQNLIYHFGATNPQYRYTAFLGDKRFQSTTYCSTYHSLFPTTNPAIRAFGQLFLQPFRNYKQKINLFHATSIVVPITTNCPLIVTIHDLIHEHYGFIPLHHRLFFNAIIKFSIERSKTVITVSQYVRQDIINRYDISPEKICAIHIGVDHQFANFSSSNIEIFKIRKGLSEPFILFLGTIEIRKNIEGLLKSYARWYKREKKIPVLVIGGGMGWQHQKIVQLVEKFGLENMVVFTGYIPQEELPYWYNAATFFVLPSLFEGFGIPILESMACGTPVITSNVTSMPEVAGDAAILVDPTNIEMLAHAMQLVANNPDLRQAMREKGFQQAAKFSWQKTAQETVAIYGKVLND